MYVIRQELRIWFYIYIYIYIYIKCYFYEIQYVQRTQFDRNPEEYDIYLYNAFVQNTLRTVYVIIH